LCVYGLSIEAGDRPIEGDMEMEYLVVYADNVEDLQRIVNNRLAAGWRPQGGLIFGLGVFYQALVKGTD
jgi:hypothetical protein